MKRGWKKLLIITGILCAASLSLYGCKDASASADPGQEILSEYNGEEPETPEEEDADDTVSETDIKDTENDAPPSAEEENLVGDVSETGNMQFVVTEAVTEEMEDGSYVMAIAADGADDSEFNHVTVVYDEDTVFYIRTIYDNGARHEDSDASAKDLKTGASVDILGYYEDGGNQFHASRVQIDDFVR